VLYITGTTSKGGMPRLTLIGVAKRYKIKYTVLSKWLGDYRERLIKEAFDIVNGTYITHFKQLYHVNIATIKLLTLIPFSIGVDNLNSFLPKGIVINKKRTAAEMEHSYDHHFTSATIVKTEKSV